MEKYYYKIVFNTLFWFYLQYFTKDNVSERLLVSDTTFRKMDLMNKSAINDV